VGYNSVADNKGLSSFV